MKVVSKTLSFMLVVAVTGIAESIKPVTANIQLAQTSTQVTTTYLPHPQLSQSVFTVFYDNIKLYFILIFRKLTEVRCRKGIIYIQKSR
jgi:hypothetical protein